jgi:hypothetical protein
MAMSSLFLPAFSPLLPYDPLILPEMIENGHPEHFDFLRKPAEEEREQNELQYGLQHTGTHDGDKCVIHARLYLSAFACPSSRLALTPLLRKRSGLYWEVDSSFQATLPGLVV